MRDLAVLLARPGQPLPALDLVEAAGGPPAAAAAASPISARSWTTPHGARTVQRLGDLDGELAEAEENADLGRLERLRAERSMLAGELAGALGLGGRVPGSPATRPSGPARPSPCASARRVKHHRAQDEALARHLRNTVRTGRLCSYEPEPGVSWQVSWQS